MKIIISLLSVLHNVYCRIFHIIAALSQGGRWRSKSWKIPKNLPDGLYYYYDGVVHRMFVEPCNCEKNCKHGIITRQCIINPSDYDDWRYPPTDGCWFVTSTMSEQME